MRNKILLFTIAVVLLSPQVNFGQAPDLGDAYSFAVFSAAGAFNVLGASTFVTGDVGTNVGAFTGFPPGTIVGQIHVADAVTEAAAPDVLTAYGFLDAITCGLVLTNPIGNGQVLEPNVYCLGEASTLNGNLTLDGQDDPDAIFIFQVDGAFATSTNTNVFLINSANLCNVFWQINGEFTLGEGSVFRGNVIANGAIHLLEGSSLYGRALTQAGAIDLHNNIVTIGLEPEPSVISADGPTTFCEGGSVILSGNNGGTWSTGATTPTITVSSAGDYFVTNTSSCSSVTSNHIIITIDPLPVASVISPDGPTTFCEGDEVILSGNVGGTWSTGATTPTITVGSAGDYYVSNTNDCGSVTSNHIIVTVTPLPEASVISADGPTTICDVDSVILSGNIGGIWNNGSGTLSITVKTSGDYYVTNTNDCGNVTSNHIIVSTIACGDGVLIPIATWALILGGILIAVFAFVRYRRII